ncbi:MAG: MFS transporter [Cytophagales bacterium]|nr:MFS transporter [Cytophaga sp.]
MLKKQTKEEEYIINENPEISIGENPGWIKSLAGAFPALNSSNFKLYFSGQLVSMIGTWMQIVAQSWLILQLTNSVFLIGLVMALSTLPTLLFTLFGGVIVDRFPKKNILLFTQICAMILAFMLGILTLFEWIELWEICAISFLLGTVNAIDAPARQAFVSELVNKEQLPSAIALNSGVFNTARVIGPGIAGIMIAWVGTGGAFLLNSFSYVAVILALRFIRVDQVVLKSMSNPFIAIREGISYSFSHPIIRTLLITIAFVSVFGWSYTTVLPVIAKNEFHLDAAGLGYLYMVTGAGSLLATILVSVLSKKISPVIFIIGGTIVFALSIILFSYTKDVAHASVLLFFSGLGLLSFAATSNSIIQTLVKNEYRGRVMSIYVLMFIGLTPIGNFQIGLVSEHMGTAFALRAGACIVLVAGLVVFYFKNRIIAEHREYKKRQL